MIGHTRGSFSLQQVTSVPDFTNMAPQISKLSPASFLKEGCSSCDVALVHTQEVLVETGRRIHQLAPRPERFKFPRTPPNSSREDPNMGPSDLSAVVQRKFAVQASWLSFVEHVMLCLDFSWN